MKNLFSRLVCSLAALSALSASAAPLYWDSNGNTVGAGATPTGTWGSSTFWNTLLDGTGATAGWVSGSDAVFSAGNDAIGVFNITLSGTQTAASLTIEEGTVNLIGTGAVSLGAGSVTINSGATLNINSSLRMSATAGSVITLNGGTLVDSNPGANGSFVDVDQTIVLGTGGGTLSYTTANTLNIIQASTTISGTGPLTKTGAGILAIASSATYTGATFINEGTLRLRTSNERLPNGTALTVASGATFDVDNRTETIGTLAGAGTVDLGSGSLITGGNGSTTFSGTIIETGATGGKFTKNGTGTLTLTGNNSFTGGLTLGNGRINFNHNNAAGTGTITVGSGADHFVSTANGIVLANDIVLNAGAKPRIYATTGNSLNLTGIISGDGGLLRDDNGGGTLTLSGANSFTGGFEITSRDIVVANKSAFGSGILTIGDAVTGPATPISILGNVDLSGANAIANSVVVNQNFTIANGSQFVDFSGPMSLPTTRTHTIASANPVTYAGVISGPGGIDKAGSGTLVLRGANTYTGETTISEGTVVLAGNGSIADSTHIRVVQGATLDVSGRVDGKLTLGAGQTISGKGTITGGLALAPNAIIAPGASVGILTVEDLTIDGPATYEFEMDAANGTAGTDWDLIDGTGALTLNLSAVNPWTIKLLGAAAGFDNSQNYVWTIAQFDNGVNNFDASHFAIDSTGFGPDLGGGTFAVSLVGNQFVNLSFSAIPEPSTIALGMLGGLALIGSAIRRRK